MSHQELSKSPIQPTITDAWIDKSIKLKKWFAINLGLSMPDKLIVALTTLLFINLGSSIGSEPLKEQSSIGGYGELHMNYVIPEKKPTPAPVLDFHRWVLFFSHQWTSDWSFASELELEHNFIEGSKATGELELELAYVQFNPQPEFAWQAGVILPAVGLLNDKHEPNLFLSVERPDYNKVIIPTTWFGNGMAIRGLLNNMFNYNLVIMEGLDDRKFQPKDGIRSGRNKGFKASLETVLFNVAVDYVATPGLTIGTSMALNKLITDPTSTHPFNSTLLWEVHSSYRTHGFWTQSEIGTISFSKNDGFTPKQKIAMGYYIDAGYDIAKLWNSHELELYPFFRVSHVNSADQLNKNGTVAQYASGMALFPISKVAIKIDYMTQSTKGVSGRTGLFNIGVGYAF